MSKTKKILLSLIPTFVGFILIMVTLFIYDSEGDGISTSGVLLLLGEFLIVLGVELVFVIAMPRMKEGISVGFSRKARVDFCLKLYAFKNERYIFKHQKNVYRTAVRHAYMDDPTVYAMPYITKKNMNGEYQSFDWKKVKRKTELNIVDARVVDDVIYLEVDLNNYRGFVSILEEIRFYEIIILNQEDIKQRDAINNGDIHINGTMDLIDKIDYAFMEVENDNRIIKKEFLDGESLDDVIDNIDKILEEYEKK